MGVTIREICEQDRPYEKCFRVGPENLSDMELLAVILRNGTFGESSLNLAMSVLSHSKKDRGLLALMDMSIPELMEIKGIGRVKAVQLKCVAELSKRIAAARREIPEKFTTPGQIAGYYMEQLRHETRERLLMMMLDVKGGLLHDVVLSVGTVDASLISPREIFIEALRYEAVRIVLIHNHPSGNPEPSGADIEVTERIEKLGNIIGIPLIDHIIIGDNSYISFRERGLIR